MNATARQAMQDRYWLLSEEYFKFVSSHRNVVIRESLFVNRLDQQGPFGFLRLTFNDERLTSSRQFLQDAAADQCDRLRRRISQTRMCGFQCMDL